MSNEDLLRDLAVASKKIHASLGMKQGGAGAEKAYGAAYQMCVDAGIKPKLRPKYQ